MARNGESAVKCSTCGRTIVFMTTAKGAKMPTDAFVTVSVLCDDGQVRRGWLPHWLTCADPEPHREQGKATTKAPPAVAGLSLLAEIKAYGGDAGAPRFELLDDAVRVTFPRVGPSTRAPAPVQTGLDLGDERPNSPADVGFGRPPVASDPHFCGRCRQRVPGGCPAPSCPLRAAPDDAIDL